MTESEDDGVPLLSASWSIPDSPTLRRDWGAIVPTASAASPDFNAGRNRLESEQREVRALNDHIQRLQSEHQSAMAQFEVMLRRVKEVRARDKSAILKREEDIAQLQQRIVHLEEHNRVQSEQLTRLNATLRDVMRERSEDQTEEERRTRRLAHNNAVVEASERRVVSLTRQLQFLQQQFDQQRCELVELRKSVADRNDDICTLESKLAAQAMEDPEIVERRERKHREALDTIHALNTNNRRLLMLLTSEMPPGGWKRFLSYSVFTDDFIYLGDIYNEKGAADTHVAGGALVPRALHELGAAVEAFRAGVERSGTPDMRKHLHDRPVCPKRENDYWIPREIFSVVSEFKSKHCPELRVELFYDMLVTINKIWRDKTKHRIAREAEKVQRQRRLSAPRRADSLPRTGLSSIIDLHVVAKDISKLKGAVQAHLKRHPHHPMVMGKTYGSTGNSTGHLGVGSAASMSRLWDAAIGTLEGLLHHASNLEACLACPATPTVVPEAAGRASASSRNGLQYLVQQVPEVVDEGCKSIANLCADCLQCLDRVLSGLAQNTAVMPQEMCELIDMQKDFMRSITRAATQCRCHVLDVVTRSQIL